MSIESQSGSEKFREDKRNLDQVQGVHNVKERPSFEEPAQRNARWARRISFQEILRFELSKSRERKVCMGDRNPFKDRSSEEITLFLSVDEILESDS
jgi:hypothetical protein